MVPFVPTSGKPVYCQDCFQQQRSNRSYDRW
jgi:CxxC-x17-CxxC domain-containing protein